MPRFITSKDVKVAMPITVRIADFFETEEQIAVEWVAPEEVGVSLFSGLYEYAKNSNETFTVRGKPGFCSVILAEIGSHGHIVDRRWQNPSVKFWIHLTGRRV